MRVRLRRQVAVSARGACLTPSRSQGEMLLGGLVPSLVGTRFVDEVRRAVLLCQLRSVVTQGV